MSNPLTLTTELEAVNLMLNAIGETRVVTLDAATHEDAGDALRLLRHWNMTVQEEGWRFNTRYDVLLTRDADGFIFPPANTLNIEAAGRDSDKNVSYIDGKLFDLDNNTFVWTEDIYTTQTLLYDFGQLPQSARNYILQCAGLEFIGNETPSSNRGQFSQSRLVNARAQLRRTEAKIRKPNMLTGSFHTLKTFAARQPFIPR